MGLHLRNLGALFALVLSACTAAPETERGAVSDETQTCAELAGDPWWLQRDHPKSTKFTEIDAPRAIAQCRTELAENPDNINLRYYLGRALLKDKNYAESYELLSETAETGNANADLLVGIHKERGNFPSDAKNEELKYYERAHTRGHVLGQFFLVERKRELDRNTPFTRDDIEGVRRAANAGWARAWFLLYLLERRQLSFDDTLRYLENGDALGDIRASEALGLLLLWSMIGGDYTGHTERGLIYRGMMLSSVGDTQARRSIDTFEKVIEKTTSESRRRRSAERLAFIYLFSEGGPNGNPSRADDLFCNTMTRAQREKFQIWTTYIRIPECELRA